MLTKKNEHIRKVYNTFLLLSKEEQEEYRARELQTKINWDNFSRNMLKQDGLREGAEKEKITTAKKMLIKGFPIADISEITGLQQDVIKNLQ